MAYSVNRGDSWDVSFWLIFDSGGGVRLTRGQPSLSRDERGMKLDVKLPHALFKTPMLRASMTIEAQEPIVPPIDLTAAAAALKGALGCDVDVRIVEQEGEHV
jgi:hypothetical protein